MKPSSKWSPKATTRSWRSSSTEGTLPVEHIFEGLHDAVKEDRSSPCCAAPPAQHRHRPGPELHARLLPQPHRAPALTAMVGDHEETETDYRQGPRHGLRLQDRRRPVRRPHHLLQGLLRRGEERCQPGLDQRRSRWSDSPTSAFRWARPSSRSPSCTPATSAWSPS